MIRATLVFLTGMTMLTGLAYPLAMTGIGAALMPQRSTGSLIEREGVTIGSALVGQPFAGAGYLHPRPSATDYAAGAGSNLGPTSAPLVADAASRGEAWEAENGGTAPIDAVTASGSGLDPDISLRNARGQAERIAAARGVDPAEVRRILRENEQRRLLGLYGEQRINVLTTNLALDAAFPPAP